MVKKVLFTGYYGFNNFGDDLFGLACVNGLRKNGKNYVPVILSPPVGGVDAKYLVPEVLSFLYKKQGVIGSLIRALFMIYGCLRYGDVVLSGGSVISSGGSSRIRKIQYFFTKIGVCRLSAIGISVGPFTTEKDRSDARRFINSLSYLTVRDEASVKECNSMGVDVEAHLYNDLAGCAPLPRTRANKSAVNNRVLGVSVCRYESIVGGDTVQESLRNISIFHGISDFAVKHDFSVNILILNSNEVVGDAGISKELSEYLSGSGVSSQVIDYVNPAESLKHISGCDIFFSVRLHGAISAYLLDVPFLLVEYHEKCKEFMDCIGFDEENRILSSVVDRAHVYKCIKAVSQGEGGFSVEPLDYIDISSKIFSESLWSR